MTLEAIREPAKEQIVGDLPQVEADRETERRFDELGLRAWSLPYYYGAGEHFHQDSVRSLGHRQAGDLDRTYRLSISGEPDLELEVRAEYVISSPTRVTVPGMEGLLANTTNAAFESLRGLRATWTAQETGKNVVSYVLSRKQLEATPSEKVNEVLDSLEEAIEVIEHC